MHPFSRNPNDRISDWGEVRLIEAIHQALGRAVPPPPYGIGDDAAVWPPPGRPAAARLVLTTDGLVYGRHFDDSASPARAAHKLLHRNLSDLAAMGATPAFLLLNLQPGPDVSKTWILEFADALGRAASAAGCAVIGGDIAGGDPGRFNAFATAGGTAERVLERRGGRPGDGLWVTGALGGSLEGRHLDFEARLAEGRFLAARGDVHAAIDLTDGMAKDLLQLLGPGLGARMRLDAVPLAPAAERAAARDGNGALDHAMTDGEDYELLFALDGDTEDRAFLEAWHAALDTPVCRIGSLVATPEGEPARWTCAETGADLARRWSRGYEHLRQTDS